MTIALTKKEEFISILIGVSSFLKLIHWNITGIGSSAIHVGTEEFYTKLDKTLDTLVETTQGEEGLLNLSFPEASLKDYKLLEYLQSTATYIEKHKTTFTKSFQQSLIEEIEEALHKLIYKVKYLK